MGTAFGRLGKTDKAALSALAVVELGQTVPSTWRDHTMGAFFRFDKDSCHPAPISYLQIASRALGQRLPKNSRHYGPMMIFLVLNPQ